MDITRLFDIPYHQLENYPQEKAFTMKVDGEWKSTSTKEYINQAMLFSKGLLKMGVKPGDKIAVISTNNRTEWHIVDIGILQVGGVNVPVYPTISTSDYEFIFNDAEIKYCIVSDKALYDKVAVIKDKVSTLEDVFSFEDITGVKSWTEVMKKGEGGSDQEVHDIMDKVKPNDLATLIYTSGTTGQPKGVMLSHANIVSNVLGSIERVPLNTGDKTLSFLPVCHVFERMILYLYQTLGLSIYFAESIDAISDNLKEVQPHAFSAVPRLLEKVYAKIVAKGNELTGVKKKLFFWALSLGDKFGSYSPLYKMQLGIARKLIFSKWQEALGGNVKVIVSGSAALEKKLQKVFFAADIPILEGYGLTETSPVISVNTTIKDQYKLGTVGKVLKGCTVKIAEDGEILLKGPNVMLGYYKRQDLTDEVIDKDGWFRTGDIGVFEGAYLKITDRKKQMFKTSGGKYVAPQLIENKMKLSPFVEQIMVIGDGKKHPSAFVVPNFEHVQLWAKENGIDYTSNEAMAANPKLKKAIMDDIDQYNQEFGKWEQVKKIELLPQEWSIEAGELTPTMKLKRKVILEKNQHLIDKIYAEK